ncbi:MAG: hypothetical protein ACYSWS_00235 [Planctomycetota bacterium]
MHSITVSTYAGYKADERPLDFVFEGKKYKIKDIVYQTCEEDISGGLSRRYTVITDEGLRFKLCCDENRDQWFLEE